MIVWAVLYFCLLLFLCFEYLIIKDSTTSADCWKIAVNCKVIASKRLIFKSWLMFLWNHQLVSKLTFSFPHKKLKNFYTFFSIKQQVVALLDHPEKTTFFPSLNLVLSKKSTCASVHSGCVKVLGKRNAYVRKEWKSFRN